MKRFSHLTLTFAVLLLYFLVFPQKAYAYLDPGSASYFFQMIIAALLGVFFTIKLYWIKIKIFFKKTIYRK